MSVSRTSLSLRTAGLGVAVLLCAAGAHAADAAAASLKFDKTFSDAAEPGAVHYQATFVSKGAAHQMEVWRDGQRRLKRSTDDTIETYVVRKPASAEYQMVILDKGRKIATRIDRSNLYRVGNFTDWYDLAHGIRHPKGDYQLVRAQAPATSVKPLAPCAWYDLTQGGQTVHVCWSARTRLPMLMVNPAGVAVWQVTRLDNKAIPAATFQVNDEGFVRNDANADMDKD